MNYSSYLRLPLEFDVNRLQQDLEKISVHEWIPHFNQNAYDSGWSCVSLRAIAGKSGHIIPFDHQPFADTPLLQRCGYFAEVLQSFKCDKKAVRLMALAPGAQIKAHRDPGTSIQDGLSRLHIPVQTSRTVEFCVENEHVHFAAGQTWYLDASCLHAVNNCSQRASIHLVLDCVTNSWLQDLFAQAGFMPKPLPKYGDPMITDANVQQVIDALRTQTSRASLEKAAQLEMLMLRQPQH
jgi:hypothetical protein